MRFYFGLFAFLHGVLMTLNAWFLGYYIGLGGAHAFVIGISFARILLNFFFFVLRGRYSHAGA